MTHRVSVFKKPPEKLVESCKNTIACVDYVFILDTDFFQIKELAIPKKIPDNTATL